MRRYQQKRRVASWVLLSVFVPMMALLTLHQHAFEADTQQACVQCEHHLPHAGHFTTATASLHDCVLCQFVTLSYLLPTAVVLAVVNMATYAAATWQHRRVVTRGAGVVSLRAPPASF